MSSFEIIYSIANLFTVVTSFYVLHKFDIRVLRKHKASWVLLFFIFFGFIEFWILGDRSFLPFGSESEVTLPALMMLNAELSNAKFLHGFAGGTDKDVVLAFSGQIFSLEQFLVDKLPLGLANFVHLNVAAGLSILGMYRLCRFFPGGTRELSLAAAVLFSFYAILFYYWGTGLGLVMMPAICFVFVCRLGKPDYFLWVLFFSVFYSVSCTPTLTALALIPALFCVSLMNGYKSTLKIIPAVCILLVAILINWHEALYAKMIVSSFTARGIETSPPSLVEVSIFLILGVLGTILAVLADRKIGLRIGLSLIIGSSLPFIGLFVVENLSFLSPLKALSFNYLRIGLNISFLLAFIIGLGLAIDAKVMQNFRFGSLVFVSRHFAFLVIMVFALGSFAEFKVRNILAWFSDGGVSILSGSVAQLAHRPWLPKEPVRVVSTGYRFSAVFPAAAGIDTLDGVLNLSPISSYWDGILKQGRNYSSHPGLKYAGIDYKCCDSYDIGTYANLDLLRIANVGFILSIVPLRGNGVMQVAGPPPEEGSLPRAYHGPWERLSRYVSLILEPAKIRVYALNTPLERVYSATSFVMAEPGIVERDFFSLIENHALRKTVVIRAEDAPDGLKLPTGNLRLGKWRLVKDGVEIDIKHGNGLVVFNSPYLPFWHAYADGKEQPVFPVNRAQMAALVPKKTRRLEFRYNRPTLRETILKHNKQNGV